MAKTHKLKKAYEYQGGGWIPSVPARDIYEHELPRFEHLIIKSKLYKKVSKKEDGE